MFQNIRYKTATVFLMKTLKMPMIFFVASASTLKLHPSTHHGSGSEIISLIIRTPESTFLLCMYSVIL